MPHAGADFFHHVLVVGHEQHGPVELLQRHVQRVDGFEVEVVGRLVEHQHVRLLQHDAAEEQPRGLAARERVRRLQPFFAAEEHLAEKAVDVLLGSVRVELVQPVHGRQALLDRAGVVLRKVTDRDLVAPPHRAAVDVARWPERRIAGGEERLEERCLAQAIPPDEDDLLAAGDDGAEVRDDRGRPMRLGHAGALHREATRGAEHRELDVGALDVRAREVVGLQPLDFLPA